MADMSLRLSDRRTLTGVLVRLGTACAVQVVFL